MTVHVLRADGIYDDEEKAVSFDVAGDRLVLFAKGGKPYKVYAEGMWVFAEMDPDEITVS